MSSTSEPAPSSSPYLGGQAGVPQAGEVLAGKYRVERVLGVGRHGRRGVRDAPGASTSGSP